MVSPSPRLLLQTEGIVHGTSAGSDPWSTARVVAGSDPWSTARVLSNGSSTSGSYCMRSSRCSVLFGTTSATVSRKNNKSAVSSLKNAEDRHPLNRSNRLSSANSLKNVAKPGSETSGWNPVVPQAGAESAVLQPAITTATTRSAQFGHSHGSFLETEAAAQALEMAFNEPSFVKREGGGEGADAGKKVRKKRVLSKRSHNAGLASEEARQIKRGLESLSDACRKMEAVAEEDSSNSAEPLAALRAGGSTTVRVRGSSSRQQRLSLMARIALHKRRMRHLSVDDEDRLKSREKEDEERGGDGASTSSESGVTVRGKKGKRGGGVGDLSETEKNELLSKYGNEFQLSLGDWERMSSLKHRLLNGEEEMRLSKLMIPMKKLEVVRSRLETDLGREPTELEWAEAVHLSVSELSQRISLGQAARNKLLVHNLRLVLWMAHRHIGRMVTGLDIKDLYQQGMVGLMEGAARYDPSRGHRFSTYATHWVRNAVMKSITKHGVTLRAPNNMGMDNLNIHRARMELMAEKGQPPTDREVIERLGMRESRFRGIRAAFRPAISLHSRDKMGFEFISSLAAEPEDALGLQAQFSADPSLRIDLDDVLDTLRPKESLVLRQRYGLDGRGFKSLVEIGRNLNISKQMVNKYEERALLKMRHPDRIRMLRKFLSPDY